MGGDDEDITSACTGDRPPAPDPLLAQPPQHRSPDAQARDPAFRGFPGFGISGTRLCLGTYTVSVCLSTFPGQLDGQPRVPSGHTWVGTMAVSISEVLKGHTLPPLPAHQESLRPSGAPVTDSYGTAGGMGRDCAPFKSPRT